MSMMGVPLSVGNFRQPARVAWSRRASGKGLPVLFRPGATADHGIRSARNETGQPQVAPARTKRWRGYAGLYVGVCVLVAGAGIAGCHGGTPLMACARCDAEHAEMPVISIFWHPGYTITGEPLSAGVVVAVWQDAYVLRATSLDSGRQSYEAGHLTQAQLDELIGLLKNDVLTHPDVDELRTIDAAYETMYVHTTSGILAMGGSPSNVESSPIAMIRRWIMSAPLANVPEHGTRLPKEPRYEDVARWLSLE